MRYAPSYAGGCAGGILTRLLTTYLIGLGDEMVIQLSKSPNRGILKHGLGSPSWRLSDTVSGKHVKVSGKRKRIAKLSPSMVAQVIKAHNLELERELALEARRAEFLKQHAKPAESYL